MGRNAVWGGSVYIDGVNVHKRQAAEQVVDEHPVVLFDGVCNVCSASVRFIHARDPSQQIKVAPLQSETAKHLLERFGLRTDDFDTIVLVEGDRYYTRSTAALRIAKRLNALWPALYAFIIVPRFIRDAVYNFVAKHRYKWFGRKDQCMVPTPELRARFLES